MDDSAKGGLPLFWEILPSFLTRSKISNFHNIFSYGQLGFKLYGRSIIIKRTKQMGANRFNSVQKATNLKKKSKVGINEMFSNC